MRAESNHHKSSASVSMLAVLALIVGLPSLRADDLINSPLDGPRQRIDTLVPYSSTDTLDLSNANPEALIFKPVDKVTPEEAEPTKLQWKPGLGDKVEKEESVETKSNSESRLASLPKKKSKPEPSEGPSLSAPRKLDDNEEELSEPSEVTLPATARQIEPVELEPIELEPTEDATEEPEHQARIAPKSGVFLPKTPAKPLDRSMQNLRSRMRTVLSYYYNKPLNTMEHDPWEIMHSMLSYELHSRVREGGPRGKPITAVGHLCFNRPAERKKMMRLDENKQLDTRVGVGLQGHKGQFLAMLAQCNVSPDYPIRVQGEEFTIRDLIESEQRTCYSKTELTFKLIGLGHYLASDATWLNDRGEVWSIPRLIEEERTQQIRGAACGGTHRLAGLSLAYRRREARGEPIDGEYLTAAKFVSEYQTMAFKLQNPDGSLSTQWFRGRGAEDDIERRIRTTGHLLEWLAYSLPDDQMTSRPMVRATSYLTNLLATYSKQDWHLGSLGHAVHALVIYDKRVFQQYDEEEIANIEVNPSSNRYRGYAIYRGVLRGMQAPSESSGGFFGMFGQSRSTQRPSGSYNR